MLGYVDGATVKSSSYATIGYYENGTFKTASYATLGYMENGVIKDSSYATLLHYDGEGPFKVKAHVCLVAFVFFFDKTFGRH